MSDLRRYFGELWGLADGDHTLLLDHGLNSDSIIFDVGGYTGEWAEHMFLKTRANLFIFEPIAEYYRALTAKFTGRVHVFQYGLASRDSISDMAKCGAGSGAFIDGYVKETVNFRDATAAAMEVLGKESLADVEIDLMAINIEGGEYDLLPAMMSTGLAYQCREIMVQFHPLWPSSFDAWRKIRARLSETHEEVFCFPFCWEKWRRR